MTSKEQMKDDEAMVFDELLSDPSLTLDQLSSKCGFSKQKTWRIVKDLDERGAIIANVSCLNPRRMGKHSFILQMQRSTKPVDDTLINIWKGRCEELRQMIDSSEIRFWTEDSYFVSGQQEWVNIITVNDTKDIVLFVEMLRKAMGSYYDRITYNEILWISDRNGMKNPGLDDFFDVYRMPFCTDR